MEKHTIQDGPIPLSGLLPLVVCRQWAFFYNVPIGSQWTFPISFKEAYVVVGNDVNSKDFTTSTQVNTFYELKASSVKLGAVTIDRRTTTFFGRVMAIGKG